jgi:hypothetical protein
MAIISLTLILAITPLAIRHYAIIINILMILFHYAITPLLLITPPLAIDTPFSLYYAIIIFIIIIIIDIIDYYCHY